MSMSQDIAMVAESGKAKILRNSAVFNIEIPLPNYYGDGIYNQSIYVRGGRSPNKEELLQILKWLHERDGPGSRTWEHERDGPGSRTWEYAQKVVSSIEDSDFPVLSATGHLAHTNTFATVPGFKKGKWPFTVSKIEILEIS